MLEERIGKRIAAIGSHKNAPIPAKKSGHTGINPPPINTLPAVPPSSGHRRRVHKCSE